MQLCKSLRLCSILAVQVKGVVFIVVDTYYMKSRLHNYPIWGLLSLPYVTPLATIHCNSICMTAKLWCVYGQEAAESPDQSIFRQWWVHRAERITSKSGSLLLKLWLVCFVMSSTALLFSRAERSSALFRTCMSISVRFTAATSLVKLSPGIFAYMTARCMDLF